MCENSAVPTGLESFSHLTQHSAFGCVLGYTELPRWGCIFGESYHRRNPILVFTHISSALTGALPAAHRQPSARTLLPTAAKTGQECRLRRCVRWGRRGRRSTLR